MRRLVLSLAMVLCAVLSAMSGELRVAVATEPPGLDPTTNAAAVIRQLLHHNLYEGLVQVDENGELHPQLAEDWEVSADGRQYTFYLRDGVRFHDGTALDAAVVAASFRRAQDPTTGHPRREDYDVIDSIEVVDELVVGFHLVQPQAAFLSLLALAQSVIVPPEADDLARHPVGTGPFQFVEWRPADRLVLARNPHYYFPDLPRLERVEFRFVRDPAAQRRALLAGSVHVVVEVTPENAVELKERPGFTVASGPSNVVQVLSINNSRAPLDQLAVRQAIAHAVDRREIIERVFFGYGTAVGSHMTPTLPYYVDLTDLHPYEPLVARELLAEAGFQDGLALNLTLPSNYAQHVRTGELIAAQLEQVGIRVNIELVDWATWLERVFSQGNYDLTVIAHPGRLDPALILSVYGPERPDYYFRRGWESAEMDQLLAEGSVEVSEERRRELYARAQEILAEEVVNVYLQDMAAIVAMRTGVSGVPILPIYALDLSRVSRE